MKRRSFINIVIFALVTKRSNYATAYSENSDSVNRTGYQKKSTKTKNRIRFTKDFFVDRINNETWSISVGLQPLGKYADSDIHVEMQIATDKDFHQIIRKKKMIANSTTGYRAKDTFVQKYLNNMLFVRFHTLQKGTHKTTGESIEKNIYSETKEISPWK